VRRTCDQRMRRVDRDLGKDDGRIKKDATLVEQRQLDRMDSKRIVLVQLEGGRVNDVASR
jgi:hypothetical protein